MCTLWPPRLVTPQLRTASRPVGTVTLDMLSVNSGSKPQPAPSKSTSQIGKEGRKKKREKLPTAQSGVKVPRVDRLVRERRKLSYLRDQLKWAAIRAIRHKRSRSRSSRDLPAIKGAVAVRQSVPIQIQVKLEANSWAMISGEQPRRSRSLTGTAYCVFESLSHTHTDTHFGRYSNRWKRGNCQDWSSSDCCWNYKKIRNQI